MLSRLQESILSQIKLESLYIISRDKRILPIFLIYATIFFFSPYTTHAQDLSINKEKFFKWEYYHGEKHVNKKVFSFIIRSDPEAKRIMTKRYINAISASLAFTGSMVYSFRIIGRGLQELDTKGSETIRTICLASGALAIATMPTLSKAVKKYNGNLTEVSYLELGITDHGIGFSYRF